jgi:PAS domain S-box-containing protein
MKTTMKTILLTAAIAAALGGGAHQSQAADNAEHQLEVVTSAMNSIPDVIFYKDMDGVYRGGNSAWAALVGKPLDQLIGKTDFDLFPADVARSFQSYDKAMLEAAQPRRNEEWLTYPDGRKVYVETLKTPWIGPDGKVLGVLGVCHEITAPAGPKSPQAK